MSYGYGGSPYRMPGYGSAGLPTPPHATTPPSPTSYGRATISSGYYTTARSVHQGSPLKERYRSTSPVEANRYTTYPSTPPSAGLRERPSSSVVADNPYNLGGLSSFKSTLSGTPTHSPGHSPGGYSSPTSTRPTFSSSIYTATRYGSPSSPQQTTSPTSGTPKQRIRGTSFREDYSGLSPRSRMKRAPSMLGGPGTLMIPEQNPEDWGKYTIVLDLDETLIFARDGPLYARPGVDDLLNLLGREAEGIAWTAGLRAYAQAVLRNIDRNSAIKHCVYRHAKWFSGQAGYQKDLSLLGRSLEKTLIIENTPDCIRGNRENGILVADYEGGEFPDNTIPKLVEFLKGLISSGMTVPQYLSQCRSLSRRKVATDRGDFIQCYWLDVHSDSTSPRSPRYNRDLPVYVCKCSYTVLFHSVLIKV